MMQVRRMLEADLPCVESIEKESFSNPWSIDSVQKAMQNSENVYLVADIDGRVVGYAGFWCSFESADLCNIAVAPGFRRRGVAVAILQEAFQLLAEKDVQKILLEVRCSNEPAILLYQREGFEILTIRKEYYTNPREDAWIMQKELLP